MKRNPLATGLQDPIDLDKLPGNDEAFSAEFGQARRPVESAAPPPPPVQDEPPRNAGSMPFDPKKGARTLIKLMDFGLPKLCSVLNEDPNMMAYKASPSEINDLEGITEDFLSSVNWSMSPSTSFALAVGSIYGPGIYNGVLKQLSKRKKKKAPEPEGTRVVYVEKKPEAQEDPHASPQEKVARNEPPPRPAEVRLVEGPGQAPAEFKDDVEKTQPWLPPANKNQKYCAWCWTPIDSTKKFCTQSHRAYFQNKFGAQASKLLP